MTPASDLLAGMQLPVVFGLVGTSGSGKTTLGLKLIQHFSALGHRVATIKHAHSGFDIDHPGKDSMRHRQAGAGKVIVSSPVRVATIEERQNEATLAELLALVDNAEIVLVEGYKRENHPKIEVYRPDNGKPALGDEFPNILAQATPNGPLDIDDVEAIASKALEIAVPISHLVNP